jgi:ribonuclease P/MRP protein subunit POP5
MKKAGNEEKLKILPSTMRMRKRYVKFKVISEEPIVYEDLEHAIWNTFLDFYGENGTAELDIWLVKNLYNGKDQIGIIRCGHKAVDRVLAGLGLLTRLGDNRIVVKILNVSGTIRGLN